MILNEFIKDAEKNQMIAAILKDHKVKVRVIHKPIKDYAYYVLGKGVLEISNRKGVIRNEKDFLITVLHETRHAVQATKMGWKKLRDSYELEIAHWQSENPKDLDGWMRNKREVISFEKEAEKYAQKNWKQWYNKFKKQNLI
tara:strand:+ start:500 stop:925 length:426 start_codon:yes stop_codon:yes gene_type:complete